MQAKASENWLELGNQSLLCIQMLSTTNLSQNIQTEVFCNVWTTSYPRQVKMRSVCKDIKSIFLEGKKGTIDSAKITQDLTIIKDCFQLLRTVSFCESYTVSAKKWSTTMSYRKLLEYQGIVLWHVSSCCHNITLKNWIIFFHWVWHFGSTNTACFLQAFGHWLAHKNIRKSKYPPLPLMIKLFVELKPFSICG